MNGPCEAAGKTGPRRFFFGV